MFGVYFNKHFQTILMDMEKYIVTSILEKIIKKIHLPLALRIFKNAFSQLMRINGLIHLTSKYSVESSL